MSLKATLLESERPQLASKPLPEAGLLVQRFQVNCSPKFTGR